MSYKGKSWEKMCWRQEKWSCRASVVVDLMGREGRGATGQSRQVEALVYHQQSGGGWRGGRSLPASQNHTRELRVKKG